MTTAWQAAPINDVVPFNFVGCSDQLIGCRWPLWTVCLSRFRPNSMSQNSTLWNQSFPPTELSSKIGRIPRWPHFPLLIPCHTRILNFFFFLIFFEKDWREHIGCEL